MDIIQNKEPKILNIGSLVLKPGFPQEVDNLEALIKTYPVLKEKLNTGKIVKLTKKAATEEQARLEKETADRLARVNKNG